MRGGAEQASTPRPKAGTLAQRRRPPRLQRRVNMNLLTELTIRPLRTEEREAWNDHVAASNNGTLFHDLDFLAYHPAGRFDFRHLVALRGDRIEAVIPGAVRPDGIFASPAGASVGGPVVTRSLRLHGALEVIERLQAHSRTQDWRGIEFTLAPAVYDNEPNQLIDFALHAAGFKLVHRAMPLLLPLRHSQSARYQNLFTQSRRSYVRASRRKGVRVLKAKSEAAPAFLDLLQETYGRLDRPPTHTSDEIMDLCRRLPDRIQIWLAWIDDIAIAGILLFILNRNVCCTFYICDRGSHRQYHGSTVLIADLIDILGDQDFRYLDLGPSASNTHLNRGVLYFKESLGARGFCRDTWRWDARADFSRAAWL